MNTKAMHPLKHPTPETPKRASLPALRLNNMRQQKKGDEIHVIFVNVLGICFRRITSMGHHGMNTTKTNFWLRPQYGPGST